MYTRTIPYENASTSFIIYSSMFRKLKWLNMFKEKNENAAIKQFWHIIYIMRQQSITMRAKIWKYMCLLLHACT